MTSVFLTRRALLSGGALVGLGALLAACGQQATNEASASAAASEAPSASATPSTGSRLLRADPRHPMESTERPTNTAQPRTYRNPASPKKATTKSL